MNIVYRFRIYPNKSQKELFARTFGCVRFVYNRMLAEKKEYYEKTGKLKIVIGQVEVADTTRLTFETIEGGIGAGTGR